MATLQAHHRSSASTDAQARKIEPVFAPDADRIARAVCCPASSSDPLSLVMFPHPSAGFSQQQRDEIIRWHAESIKDALINGRTHLRKLRLGNGDVVGLAGWVIERGAGERAEPGENWVEAVTGSQKPEPWLPETLDISAWLELSAVLRAERQRVIGNLVNVCRTSHSLIHPKSH